MYLPNLALFYCDTVTVKCCFVFDIYLHLLMLNSFMVFESVLSQCPICVDPSSCLLFTLRVSRHHYWL